MTALCSGVARIFLGWGPTSGSNEGGAAKRRVGQGGSGGVLPPRKFLKIRIDLEHSDGYLAYNFLSNLVKFYE